MQRGLHRTRHDLYTPGETGRRRDEEQDRRRRDLAGRGDPRHHHRIGRLARFKHAHHGLDLFPAADSLEDRFLARGRPHRAGAHRKELSLLDRPPRILARKTGLDGMIRAHLHDWARNSVNIARREGDRSQVSHAHPGQIQAGRQAPQCFDPAVDESSSSLDRMDGDPPLLGVLYDRFGELERPHIQIHSGLPSVRPLQHAREQLALPTLGEIAIVSLHLQ